MIVQLGFMIVLRIQLSIKNKSKVKLSYESHLRAANSFARNIWSGTRVNTNPVAKKTADPTSW